MSLLALFSVMVVASASPVPVIMDTDIGGDIDDTWALCMLLGTPQVDLKLITTAFDNTPRKAALVAKILERAGRTEIPIGIGIKTKDVPTNQETWIGDFSLKNYKGKVFDDGVQAIIDAIRSAPGQITLLIIGPQTNIQAALRRAPEIAQKARVVAMAGSVEVGYNGKKGRDPEYNIVADIPAARAVFAAPWDITWTPLDTCGTIILRGDKYAAIHDCQSARAKIVIENFEAWTNYKHITQGMSSVLFDTVAAYLAFDTSLCQMKTVKLKIDDKGMSVPDEGGRPVQCAMDWKDRKQFENLLMNSLK